MRAKVYTRYSTDRQRETSTEDQLRLARDRIRAEAWRYAGVHSDSGVSGSVPVSSRAGGAALLAAAAGGEFDVLVLEGLDRLSRDLVEQERIVRRLEHNGIRIVGVSDGYDSTSKARKIHRGMRGMINEIYLDDLREKIHRGQVGQVKRKLSAGGMPYGYRPVTRELGQDLEIEPAAADVVRWIYERYLDGWSPRKIVYALNEPDNRTPGPRGGTWVQSALYGHPKYQTGILRNPIYAGRYVWNRSQWVKDPETGKRKRRERKRSEWLTEDRPELRIVPAHVWEAVQARITKPEHAKGGRPARAPLSGLLQCPLCRGAVVAISQRFYGCAARKDRGPSVCAGVRIKRSVLEETAITIARNDLLSPAAIAEMREEAVRQQRAAARASTAAGAAAGKRLVELDRKIERLVDAVSHAGWSSALDARLRQAEAEREQLQRAGTEATKPPLGTLVPRQLDRWRELIDNLPATLQRAPDEARQALRQLLGVVRLTHEAGKVFLEVPDFGVILTVVAGVGFEPTTFGL